MEIESFQGITPAVMETLQNELSDIMDKHAETGQGVLYSFISHAKVILG